MHKWGIKLCYALGKKLRGLRIIDRRVEVTRDGSIALVDYGED